MLQQTQIKAGQLLERVERLSCRLAGMRGAVVGDPDDPIDFATLLLAGFAAGTPVIIAPRERRIMARVAADFPRLCVIDDAYAAEWHAVAPDADIVHLDHLLHGFQKLSCDVSPRGGTYPLGPDCVVYTSGATGSPVGVITTQTALACNADDLVRAARIAAGGNLAICAPFHHSYGLAVGLVLPLMLGVTVHPIPYTHPRDTLRRLSKACSNILITSPQIYRGFLLHAHEIRHCTAGIEHFISSGSDLSTNLLNRYCADYGISILNVYGTTETQAIALSQDGGVMTPLPSVDVEITVPTDSRGDQGGNLLISGPKVTPGYWRNETLTRERLKQGAFVTGDIARKSGGGTFELLGRQASVIKVADQRVHAEEVEACLENLDNVGEAMVFGIPDATHGQVVAAWIRKAAGHPTPDVHSIVARVALMLPPYMVPRTIQIVDEIPSRNGKKMRHLGT
jgi:acyl-coenzyme A synthetase/AMP-(fatty) acid ligase